jgi:SPP1 family predicted phage head-tail adaptor
MKLTPAGEMRQRLTHNRITGSTTDAMGQPVPTWQAIGTRWAKVAALSGRELWNAQEIQPDATVEIRMRYDRSLAITERDRGTMNGRTFEYLYVIDLEERHIEWKILAIEVRGGGVG